MRLLVLCLTLLIPAGAFAQQRPLVTEDPETIGAGRMLIEGGLHYDRSIQFPVSGLEGNLLKAPTIGISIGVSSIAEIQIDGGLFNRLTITSRNPAAPLAAMVDVRGDSTSDVEDIVIGTKIRLVPEGVTRPSFGFRFATRLPNASNESGLGMDTTDFFASVLLAKTVQSVRVVGNVGLGILGDPVRGDRQNDVMLYGLSFARAITTNGELVGEFNGRLNTREGGDLPPGTDSRGIVKFGGRYTVGSWRGDAAVQVGVTSRDPSVGFTTGFTYVFNAFQVP